MVVRKTVATAQNKAVDKPNIAKLSDEALRNAVTLEDAMRLMAETYGGVDSIEDLEFGNGFKILENKDRLVGVPFLILVSDFHFGDYGEFATMMVMTMDGTNARLILNDGSTGICDSLRQLVLTAGKNGGIAVPQGLSKSVYTCCPECGHPLPKMNADGPITQCQNCTKDVGESRQPGATYYFKVG